MMFLLCKHVRLTCVFNKLMMMIIIIININIIITE